MPAPRLLIIADAHVGTPPPESEAALIRFLHAAPDLGDALLIAGDLFEFWFAYRRTVPIRAFPVAAALAELARRMPVAMVGGNHDRWGRPFWAEQASIVWAPDQLDGEFAGQRLLALHGDGLVEQAGRAAWMHRLVSHGWTSRGFAFIHPDLGLALVDHLRPVLSNESSRSPAEKQRRADRQREWVAARMKADPGPALIVMGHTHVPAVVELEPGRWYVNPGAWFEEYRYARTGDAGPELHRFNPAAPLPLPRDARR